MIVREAVKGDAPSTATYSECERYRYALTREWAPEQGRLLCVMLNPSTATEAQNDPTVERCERRARALGYGAFRVCNIFAWRSTDPKVLRTLADPIGPENDRAIGEGAAWADRVLCAWGSHGAHLGRGTEVERLLRASGARLCHLGLTRAGHPRHPLYVAYATEPVDWGGTPGTAAG
jgi:hypothetical protein